MTTTLFRIIQSELLKKGFNEFTDSEGNLVFYDEDDQFMTKIFAYDKDVSEIVDKLFSRAELKQYDFDKHFKMTFIYRFLNRRINRQTVESFRMELLSTFLMNQDYINRVYADMDLYITQTSTSDQKNKQTNKQLNDGITTTDNRQAFAELPQNNVQLDVNSTIMTTASDNTISRNKQSNKQLTDAETDGSTIGESKSYRLEELFKTSGTMENIFNKFDIKCFMQTW